MRQRIAQRLKESQETAASLTTFNEVDMSAIIELRNLYKEEILKKHNVKFGFMSAFVKACSVALSELPMINSRIDGNEIVTSNSVDISVAVATPKVGKIRIGRRNRFIFLSLLWIVFIFYSRVLSPLYYVIVKPWEWWKWRKPLLSLEIG